MLPQEHGARASYRSRCVNRGRFPTRRATPDVIHLHAERKGDIPNIRAEQRFAGDALQPTLVPRSGFQARLKPGVRLPVWIDVVIRYGDARPLLGGAHGRTDPS